MSNNKLADLSLGFSIKVLTTTEDIKGHHSIINQLERSATSIGANIRERDTQIAKPTLFLNYT